MMPVTGIRHLRSIITYSDVLIVGISGSKKNPLGIEFQGGFIVDQLIGRRTTSVGRHHRHRRCWYEELGALPRSRSTGVR